MKTIVWTLPSRIFHWYLAVGILMAYLYSDNLQVHAAIGLSVGMLLLFRLIWGLAGPRYSRFRDFPLAPATIFFYIKNMKSQEHLYTGHNPAASVVMLLIILSAIGTASTGLVTALSDETELFGSARFTDIEQNYALHKIFMTVLFSLIGVHLVGLLMSHIIDRRSRVVLSMFSGVKRLPGINANLTIWQRALAFVAGTAAIIVLVVVLLR